jgi:glycosyltransferase involved in cell wall biosynthesis
MFVRDKSAEDASVTEFVKGRGSSSSLMARVRRFRVRRENKALRKRFAGTSILLTQDRAVYPWEPWLQCPPCDVINLHWVADFVDYEGFFGWASASLPIVWTFHDMNAFTGGCHYDGGCGRFAGECGDCPQLASKNQDDLTHRIWARKKAALSRLDSKRMHVVTPSNWMGAQSRASSLFSRFTHSVIPYGLDTTVFRPLNKRAMREALGVPMEAAVVLFVGQWIDDPRKGFRLLAEALKEMEINRDLFVISLGSGQPMDLGSVPCLHLGPVRNDPLLCCAYNAADVFVAPSLEDNLPNTVLESIACGTPVVAFRAGGMPDAVRPGETGLLASLGSTPDLREAIATLLRDSAKRLEMSARCRVVAENEYALGVQARRYLDLYGDLRLGKTREASGCYEDAPAVLRAT